MDSLPDMVNALKDPARSLDGLLVDPLFALYMSVFLAERDIESVAIIPHDSVHVSTMCTLTLSFFVTVYK